jgi:hypothetical protein
VRPGSRELTPVVKELDHLIFIFIHKLAVFESFLGAEFLDGGRSTVGCVGSRVGRGHEARGGG